MELFLTQHALSQGSLHYSLATLGYRKRNTYGVETFIPLRDLYHFASQFAAFNPVFCVISSHDLRQITTAIHINKEMMDFTPQNRGKWITPLPSTNRINNTRITHPILNLIATLPSMIQINNRGEGKEQYKRLCIRNGIKQNTKWHATKQEMTQQKKRISFTDALSFIVMRCD